MPSVPKIKTFENIIINKEVILRDFQSISIILGNAIVTPRIRKMKYDE